MENWRGELLITSFQMKYIKFASAICFFTFLALGSAHAQSAAPSAKSSCVHWTKTVDLDGLDETAMGLEPDGYYCAKPDKVIVDNHHASIPKADQDESSYHSGRGYGHRASGGHSHRR